MSNTKIAALEEIEFLFSHMPIDLSMAEPVVISTGFRELFDEITWDCMQFRECFNNAAVLALSKNNVQYCIGYANAILPVEHAWICKDGKYYDPTWEKHSCVGDAYMLIKKFTHKELHAFLKKSDNHPPELWRMSRHGYLNSKKITSPEEQFLLEYSDHQKKVFSL